jgi:hypothetical protein
MNEWKLADCFEPIEEPEDCPVFPFTSEEELRNLLDRFRQRSPSLIILDSPEGEHLKIHIGGPFAGLRWIKGKVGAFAQADQICCPEGVEFVEEGVENLFQPEELLPVDEVIEGVVYYFKNRRLPDFITWKVWNPATDRWDVLPASQAWNGQAERSSTPADSSMSGAPSTRG